MARTVESYTSQAVEAFEAGFTSKAGQKRAFEALSRAYELLGTSIRGIYLDKPHEERNAAEEAIYWGLPDLHNWKAKHSAAVLAVYPQVTSEVAQIEALVELRAAIKSAEIVKVERKADARVEAIQGSIRALMEKRQAQYARGLELHDLFGRLPVYANVHMVTNAHGTTFMRAFYFMYDKLTPLNVILAVMQAKAAEAK